MKINTNCKRRERSAERFLLKCVAGGTETVKCLSFGWFSFTFLQNSNTGKATKATEAQYCDYCTRCFLNIIKYNLLPFSAIGWGATVLGLDFSKVYRLYSTNPMSLWFIHSNAQFLTESYLWESLLVYMIHHYHLIVKGSSCPPRAVKRRGNCWGHILRTQARQESGSRKEL